MNESTFFKWFFTFGICALLFLSFENIADAYFNAKRPIQTIQAGTAVLHFNGGYNAMTQVDFNPPFTTRPIIVCSPSNEWSAGIEVGCQALNEGIAGVSAQLPYTTTLELDVHWIAAGEGVIR